jgi:hypothetical protein
LTAVPQRSIRQLVFRHLIAPVCFTRCLIPGFDGGVLGETRLLTQATKRAGAEKRRLGPPSGQGIDVGVAHADLRRWVESNGPARIRRVRLTDLGRATLWLRIVQRTRPSGRRRSQ